MLSLFRTNQASAGLLLFFYALILQLPLLFGWEALPAVSAEGGILSTWLIKWLEGRFYLAALLPVFLVTGQGIIANVLVTRHRLSRQITQFPGLFLVLCWALAPAFRSFHPVQVASFLTLLGLLALGRVYKKEEPAVPIFNAGAWLGLACLFCPAYLALLPAFIVGIGILRRPDLRSVFQLLAGLILPTFLALAYVYLRGSGAEGLSAQFSNFSWWIWTNPTTPNQLGLAVLGLLLIFVIGAIGRTGQLLNIEGKKNLGILYWLLFFFCLSIGVSGASGIPYLQVITVPMGIILGLRFITVPPGRAEFFHLLLFTAAVGTAIWSAFSPMTQ